jgi:hypothetical protein
MPRVRLIGHPHSSAIVLGSGSLNGRSDILVGGFAKRGRGRFPKRPSWLSGSAERSSPLSRDLRAAGEATEKYFHYRADESAAAGLDGLWSTPATVVPLCERAPERSEATPEAARLHEPV